MKDGKRCHSYFKGDVRVSTAKIRKIYYANHMDSMIYAYYANVVLGKLYERLLKNHPDINHAVVAYRKIEKVKDKNKSSVDFANEVFIAIKNRLKTDGECVAISFDIEKFFDSLDHRHLKKAWKFLLGLQDNDQLPPDHYAVYKAVTKSAYVCLEDVADVIGLKHVNDLRRKEIDSFAHNYSEFRAKFAKSGKVRQHPFSKVLDNGKTVRRGIPQGTPISSFLSNLYMFECDSKICELVSHCGGYYRRYSDDLVILCHKSDSAFLIEKVIATIKNDCGLEIQETKTQLNRFEVFQNEVKCFQGNTSKEKAFQYLGFEFDGKRVLIRPSSISKFYRKLKASVSRRIRLVEKMKRAAGKRLKMPDKLNGVLFKGPIYSRYSYQGRRGAKRNYFHYAADASRIMSELAITSQLKKAWKNLEKFLSRKGH